jgi:hypothetical protein
VVGRRHDYECQEATVKSRVSRGDIFVHKDSMAVVWVMHCSKDHKHFGDMLGVITIRPFTVRPAGQNMLLALLSDDSHDTTMV